MQALATQHQPAFKSQLERAYWYDELFLLLKADEIHEAFYESVTFTIGWDERGRARRYTPDFMVIRKDGIVEFHETKGSKQAKGQGAAMARFYAAVALYPQFRWVLVTKEQGAFVKKVATPG